MNDCNPIHVTVLSHPYVPSPESAEEIDPALVVGVSLRDALTRVWPTDAHLTAYEPVELAALDADGNETGATIPVRLTRSAIAEGISPRMVAMIGDVDPPGHTATPEWRAEVEPRLDASGLAWYSTRNGYRVVATIADPFELSSVADELQWYDIVLGWREYLLATHDIEIDPKCKDWTRIMRLPNVQRDGQPARSDVRHLDTMPAWTFGQWLQPPGDAAPRATPRTDGAPDDARTARARHIAERMPASIEGLGGDEALFVAANEVATQLGEDAAAIESVLADTFNPRCDPPWPSAKLRYEAERAAARQATPEARHMRRADERRAELDGNAATVMVTAPGETGDLVFGTLSANPPVQSFLVPELEIGVGRPWGWLGKTNASKTIAIQQLEIDLVLGRPVFGIFAGPGAPVKVLHIAYEGFTKAAEDYLRLLRGTGAPLDFAALNERLRFAEGRTHFDADPSNSARAWLLPYLGGFKGGLCVIDPWVAACRGLDENSTEIAQPLYELESISKEAGVAIIVAHHFGHSAQRARGSSAIEGAFGASAMIAQPEGGGNSRQVTGCKRNRYGVQAFGLTIHDTNADGSAWVATSEALQRREVSWGLRIVGALGGSTPIAARSSNLRDTNAQRKWEADRSTRVAGERIWRQLNEGVEGHYKFDTMVHIGGESTKAARRALSLMGDRRWVDFLGGAYSLSDAGRAASQAEVLAALGREGPPFVRPQ